MITKQETVVSEAAIWAIPVEEWRRKTDPELGLFEYKIITHSPWESGAVKVIDVTVAGVVPEGINLLQRAIETLEDAKLEKFKAYKEAEARIDQQIAGLLMIGHEAPSAEFGAGPFPEDEVVASVESLEEYLPDDYPF